MAERSPVDWPEHRSLERLPGLFEDWNKIALPGGVPEDWIEYINRIWPAVAALHDAVFSGNDSSAFSNTMQEMKQSPFAAEKLKDMEDFLRCYCAVKYGILAMILQSCHHTLDKPVFGQLTRDIGRLLILLVGDEESTNEVTKAGLFRYCGCKETSDLVIPTEACVFFPHLQGGCFCKCRLTEKGKVQNGFDEFKKVIFWDDFINQSPKCVHPLDNDDDDDDDDD